MSTIRVATNFNIDLEFEAAPFHRRLAAWLLDVIISIFYCFIVFKIVNLLFHSRSSGASDFEGISALYMFLLIPVITYHLFCEMLLNGQSVGKRIMALKVVNEDGGRPSISQYIIRWLIRTSDYMILLIVLSSPGAIQSSSQFFIQVSAAFSLLLADIILVNSSIKHQRLGDMLAHTMLIKNVQKANIRDTIFLETEQSYIPVFPQVMNLSDNDINTLKGILDAAIKHSDFKLAHRASEKIKNHLKITTSMSPFDFLETLLKDYNYLSAN